MSCCHTDFALTADSDKAFTVGMPTFTFGAGCLAETGAHAQELGLKRVALFTDKTLKDSEHLATALTSLAAAQIDVAIYDEVTIEPTTKADSTAMYRSVGARCSTPARRRTCTPPTRPIS
jgi:alcohol dehydrogenase class IV